MPLTFIALTSAPRSTIFIALPLPSSPAISAALTVRVSHFDDSSSIIPSGYLAAPIRIGD